MWSSSDRHSSSCALQVAPLATALRYPLLASQQLASQDLILVPFVCRRAAHFANYAAEDEETAALTGKEV